MNLIALIPARGGSKRLPRKNVIDFLGRPIIDYTIEAARKSGCFDRVVVSTEDAEIARVARACGADIDERPETLATDAARVMDVCCDFLDREKIQGRDWKQMAVLYATAPLRDAGDIRATMALLERNQCDFAMAVTSFDLPPHQALKFTDDGSLEPMWPELISSRSAELPRLRVDNGSTYAVDVEAFRRVKSFYGPGLRGHDMPRERSIDIDTQRDLDVALWEARRKSAGRLDTVSGDVR